ncbi:MAG: response regulator transcription factor [Pseudomonadales bacterium]|nr:response regulator transcription factor [Pseudomonadales bacterium]NRA14693.1 response regulator transcription factor [Oceanospirillaceae bacterium]
MQQVELLLVDDDRELTALLSEYLNYEGLITTIADSGEQALALLESSKNFDIAVFDIMMPGMSGLELLQQLRPRITLPVIMLTGKGGDIDRILGLEMGADDYLAKPCNPRELLARIKAVLRRSQQQAVTKPGNNNIALMGVVLSPSTREVQVAGQLLELTSAEFNVLHQLMLQPGVVVSKSVLTEKVLHRQLTAYDRSIDVHLSRVRQKLAALNNGVELIKTVRGEGYLFVQGLADKAAKANNV